MRPIVSGLRRPPRRLLLSVHDVSPRHAREVEMLRDLLRRDGDAPVALLVVPDFWNEAPIVPGSPFARRLREWADGGDEIFLHGYNHIDRTMHRSPIARFKARHLTAREGEFLGLDERDAAARITHGRKRIEDITGRAIAGFIAPAWLYGAGARAAMATAGVTLAEDHWRIWEPGSDRILARAPVVTWATRTPGRMVSSLAVAAIARHVPLPRVMRIGVHPGDCGEPWVTDSIAATVRAMRRSHRPSRYDALAEDVACAS